MEIVAPSTNFSEHPAPLPLTWRLLVEFAATFAGLIREQLLGKPEGRVAICRHIRRRNGSPWTTNDAIIFATAVWQDGSF